MGVSLCKSSDQNGKSKHCRDKFVTSFKSFRMCFRLSILSFKTAQITKYLKLLNLCFRILTIKACIRKINCLIPVILRWYVLGVIMIDFLIAVPSKPFAFYFLLDVIRKQRTKCFGYLEVKLLTCFIGF